MTSPKAQRPGGGDVNFRTQLLDADFQARDERASGACLRRVDSRVEADAARGFAIADKRLPNSGAVVRLFNNRKVAH